jgi:phospholipase/carboxylesterase
MTSRLTSDLLHLSTVASAGNAASRRAGDLATGFSAGELPAATSQIELQIPRHAADDLHIPDHYEAGYAYPLIVWLTPADGPQRDFRALMRRISDRNCFGVAVRNRPGQRLEECIFETVVGLRRKYHVHSERIYLAGVGDEALLALQTGLARPEWFGGIVALSPDLPSQQRWLTHFDALRGKRVLLGAGCDDVAQVESVRRLQRLLWSAGLSVNACSYDFRNQIDDGLLREIDRWMMQSIEETVTA